MAEEFLKKAAETKEATNIKQTLILDKVFAVINAEINKQKAAETADETFPLEAEFETVSGIANNVGKDDYYDNVVRPQANKFECPPYVANAVSKSEVTPSLIDTSNVSMTSQTDRVTFQ